MEYNLVVTNIRQLELSRLDLQEPRRYGDSKTQLRTLGGVQRVRREINNFHNGRSSVLDEGNGKLIVRAAGESSPRYGCVRNRGAPGRTFENNRRCAGRSGNKARTHAVYH